MSKLSAVFAAAALSASLGAYAATPTDAPAFGVNIPNLRGGIMVTLEGLLLRPTNNDLDYATVNQTTFSGFNTNTPVVSIGNENQSVNPDYDFGFRVGVGYMFPDSGNDVQLNWTHFSHSNDGSTTADPGEILVTGIGVPLLNPFPSDSGITGDVSANSNVDTKLDTVDLDVGQYVNFGTRLQARFFGGLQFSRVEQDSDNDYNAVYTNDLLPPATLAYNEDDHFDSKFTGVGPRFGVDTSYNVWNCFGVVGHVAGALLVGKVDTSTNNDVNIGVSTGGEDPDQFSVDFPASIDTDNQWRVVPTFDAKVGLNYTWIFQNQSALTLEAGYQVTEFFNAVDTYANTISVGSSVEGVPVVVVNGTSKTTSDVGFDGPYLSLNYKM